MKKEKTGSVVQWIILATALFNIFTAALNLVVSASKAVPPSPSTPPAISQPVCPVAAAPQVIQYLNVLPTRENEKEPSRPGGQ